MITTMPKDYTQTFQFNNMNMRGRLIRMNDVLDQIIGQHDYPDWVGFQLAECLLLNAAIGSAIKLRGKLSLQIQSEGSVKLISTDYFAAQPGGTPTLRGYVKFDQERHNNDEPLYKKGVFGLLISQDGNTQPYQGMTSISDVLTHSAITYFKQSEQIPTIFHVDLARDELNKKWLGGAIMVQQIAEEDGSNNHSQSTDDLRRVEALLSTIKSEEILSSTISGEELIYRLFHEDNPTATPAQPIAFGCPCSEEKVRQSLSIYSRKDLGHMITEDGNITADCQFCGAHYVMDPDSVGLENA